MAPSTRRSMRSNKRAPPLTVFEQADELKNEIQSLADQGHQVISSVSGSDAENADVLTRKKARVSFSMDVASQSSPMSTSENQSKDVIDASKDISGPSMSQKASNGINRRTARAQRSLRRQSHGIKEMIVDQGIRLHQRLLVPFKKQLPGTNIQVDSSSLPQKIKANKTDELVKVKLNTGTLLLYKGHHRRAVFLRRC